MAKKKKKKKAPATKTWAEKEADAKAAKIKAAREKKAKAAEEARKAVKDAAWQEKCRIEEEKQAAADAVEAAETAALIEKLGPSCERLSRLRERGHVEWVHTEQWHMLGEWRSKWVEWNMTMTVPETLVLEGRTAWHWRAQQGFLQVLLAMRRQELGALVGYQVFGRVRRHLNKTKLNVTKAFMEFDDDGSGALSFRELRECLLSLSIELDDEEFGVMVAMIDEDGGGSIDINEFIEAVKQYGQQEDDGCKHKASCDQGAESDGRSPFQDSVVNGHVEVAQWLVDLMGADKEWKTLQGETGLHLACMHDMLVMLKFLVEELRVDLQCVTYQGWNSAHLAARLGHKEVLRYLVWEAGAHAHALDPDDAVNGGWTPIHLAALGGHSDCAEFLVQGCAVDPNSVTDEGSSAVMIASYSNHLKMVECLVELGADPMQLDPDGATALHMAAMEGHLQIVQWLVENGGVAADSATYAGETALYLACKNNRTDCVRWLSQQELTHCHNILPRVPRSCHLQDLPGLGGVAFVTKLG